MCNRLRQTSNGQRPRPMALSSVNRPVAKPGNAAVPAAVAAKEAAAARNRTGARQYRGSAKSQDSLREKVRAEMRAEAAASRQKAMVKIEAEEAVRRREVEVQQQTLREAKVEYARALREEEQSAASSWRQAAEASEAAVATTEAAAEEEAGAEAATEVDAEPTHAERVQVLLAERAARRRDDASGVEAFRQRIAARRGDSDRFNNGAPARRSSAAAAGGVQPTTDAITNRSLFHWAPPVDAAADAAPSTAQSAAPRAAGHKAVRPMKSEAAMAAWEWAHAQPTAPAPADGKENED